MSGFETIDHGEKEGFCPRCYDYHPFSVTEKRPPGVVAASCMKCGFAAEPSEVPHDADEADEKYPDEVGR
jgi:hypothetical protein